MKALRQKLNRLSIKQAACVLSDEARKNTYSTLIDKQTLKIMMTANRIRAFILLEGPIGQDRKKCQIYSVHNVNQK